MGFGDVCVDVICSCCLPLLFIEKSQCFATSGSKSCK